MVSPVGLGCWQFAGGGVSSAFWKSPPQEEINEIVAVSLAGGINWFDTAEGYGFGRSEQSLSAALTQAGKGDGDVVIATKWHPVLRTAASIAATFPSREKYLAPFHVDLLQVHMPYSFSSVEAQMKAMADLLDAKKIKAVGVSNFSEAQMRRAHKALGARGFSLASNQVRYSLADRSIEKNGVLAAARELGISIIAYSPLAQGLLSGRYHSDAAAVGRLPFLRRRRFGGLLEKTRPLVELLTSVAASHGATPCQVALNWLIYRHGESVVAIPGATRVEQARQNCRAMSFRLSAAEMAALDEASGRLS